MGSHMCALDLAKSLPPLPSASHNAWDVLPTKGDSVHALWPDLEVVGDALTPRRSQHNIRGLEIWHPNLGCGASPKQARVVDLEDEAA